MRSGTKALIHAIVLTYHVVVINGGGFYLFAKGRMNDEMVTCWAAFNTILIVYGIILTRHNKAAKRRI